MTYGYITNKTALLQRLNRAEGQVRGVAKMVEQDVYCIDIMTQISAAQAALDKIALELLREHAKHCMSHETTEQGKDKKADELVKAIGRLI